MIGTAITDAILWDLAILHYNSELKRNAEKIHLQDCSLSLSLISLNLTACGHMSH